MDRLATRQAAITDYQIARARVKAAQRGATPAEVERNVMLFDSDEFPVKVTIGGVFKR